MTTDRTGPVLDVDRLDAAADVALAGVRLDLGVVRARSATARRGRARRWGLVVAAAAAVLLVASVVGGGVGALRGAPQPAATPSGPGALPERVYPLPRLVPSVADRPVARVALVLAGEVTDLGWGGSTTFTGPVLVSADGGEYRRLPAGQVRAVSVSADGRTVAWADLLGDVPDGVTDEVAAQIQTGDAVRWVDVATGRVRSVTLPHPAEDALGVVWTAVSPDGGTVAVATERTLRRGGDATHLDVWTVDTRNGTVGAICAGCQDDLAWARDGRLLGRDENGAMPAEAGGLMPARGDVANSWTQLVAASSTFVSPDGTRRLLMGQGDPNRFGEPDDFRLVEVDVNGTAVRTTSLGRLLDATLLAWTGDRALVRVDDPSGPPEQRNQVRQVDLVTGAQTPVLAAVDPDATGYPVVELVAQDVAAGGRTAATPPPVAPWWSPVVDVMDVVLGPVVLTLVGLAVGPFLVGLLVRAVRRRLPRRAPRAPAAGPPSRMAEAASEAGRDFFGGALDRRAHPGTRSSAPRDGDLPDDRHGDELPDEEPAP